MQDLNDMMVFLAVVESKSFTAAAVRLNMPKANVSRKVAKLEQQLGIVLLERSTRSQTLTQAGRQYLTHCKRIQQEMDLANSAISTELNETRGRIKLGASVTIGQQLLSPNLPGFLSRYPDIALELSLLNRRVDLIEEGFDVLIRVGKIDDSRLVAKHFGDTKRKLYASQTYLKQNGTPENITALDRHAHLIMNPNMAQQPITLHNKQASHRLTTAPRVLTDDFAIIKDAAVNHQGIAILPDYIAKPELDSGKLTDVLSDWAMPTIGIYALYPKHRSSIPRIHVLLEFLSHLFETHLLKTD